MLVIHMRSGHLEWPGVQMRGWHPSPKNPVSVPLSEICTSNLVAEFGGFVLLFRPVQILDSKLRVCSTCSHKFLSCMQTRSLLHTDSHHDTGSNHHTGWWPQLRNHYFS
uniref:Uncharacterized protein n=1 Tax=Eutreptiella gymnastica TaxID=73025 RepID=A0A7S4GG03_9EUGL